MSYRKVCEDQVREIRHECRKFSVRSLARKYRLSEGEIRHIIARRRWGWVK